MSLFWHLQFWGWFLELQRMPYILKSNQDPFYSFRGLKKSDADYNRRRIRFTAESWILEKWWSRCTCRKNNTIQYNNLLFYLLLIIIIYFSSDSPSSLITESLSVLRRDRARLLRERERSTSRYRYDSLAPGVASDFNASGNIRYYSISRPVGKGWLKERCRLESQTNFFPFQKSPKTECGLDSRIYGICDHRLHNELLK